jgi:hypothetical protein
VNRVAIATAEEMSEKIANLRALQLHDAGAERLRSDFSNDS